jgi:YidC/Oxa1 family membrane protein insertase
MWIFPGLSLAFTWWLPAGAQLTFLVTGVASYIQVSCFRQDWFRNFFGMTPIPKRRPTGPTDKPPSPYQGVMKRAASPVLSQAELNSRFQSTSTSFPRPPNEADSKLGKIMNTALKPLAPIKDAMKPTIEAAKKQMDKRQDKSNRKDAQSYEEKRRKEIAKQTLERQEIERERREARKAQKNRKSS